jgi:hypothetical protein
MVVTALLFGDLGHSSYPQAWAESRVARVGPLSIDIISPFHSVTLPQGF